MQRVLSFQMARGLGEPSELVTKRMCFSLIFSVGFLSLLCGFLLGRFATQRAIEYRAEKKRLELAGNGLENTEYLQHLLLQQLETAPLDSDFETKWESFTLEENDARQVNGVLSNLSFIQKVVQHQSYIVATIHGSREPDRYVVLSASGESVGIVLQLAKILNRIQGEHRWRPRRSLVFCFFSGSANPCKEIISSLLPHRIVAYIVMHHQALKGKGPFIVSGSDIVQSMVLESAFIVKNWSPYNNHLLYLKNNFYNVPISRLDLDIPHAVLSFANNNFTYNEDHHERETRKIVLAQILGQTVWRFSESLIVKWDLNYFNNTVYKILKSVNSSELLEVKEKVQKTVDNLLTNIRILHNKIDTIDNINNLDTRILNDLQMDLDRVLLCPNKQHRSITDWTQFQKISQEHFKISSAYINEVVKCYENAIQLLQDR